MVKKVRTNVQTELLQASPVPENRNGWCERCKKSLRTVVTEGGDQHAACPGCKVCFRRRRSGGPVDVMVAMMGGFLPRFEVVSVQPYVVSFRLENESARWSVTLPADWSE